MIRIYRWVRMVKSQLLRLSDRLLTLDSEVIQIHIIMVFLFKLINSKLVSQNPNQDLNPATMSYRVNLNCRRFSLFAILLLFCLGVLAQGNFDAVDQLVKQNQKALGQ